MNIVIPVLLLFLVALNVQISAQCEDDAYETTGSSDEPTDGGPSPEELHSIFPAPRVSVMYDEGKSAAPRGRTLTCPPKHPKCRNWDERLCDCYDAML